MLNLPVYTRQGTYYLHTRIAGKQVKKSLGTKDKATAIIRASRLLEALKMTIDLSKIQKYQIDLSRGIAIADGQDDHKRLLEALQALQVSRDAQAFTFPPKPPQGASIEVQGLPATHSGLTLIELLDKYLLLKQVKPATVTALKNTVKEFSAYVGKGCYILEVLKSDMTRYQEYLAIKGNVPRTIDGKIGYLKTLFNFAIKQGYTKEENPAEGLALLTKRQKLTGGYAIFEDQEIKAIFGSEYFKDQKVKDPDYYYCLLLGLVSGCRVNEITSLQADQFQKTEKGNHFLIIRDSKTHAGKREVPLPADLFDEDFKAFLVENSKKHKGQVFKYGAKSRTGKGAGNAVGKKFARHLEELKISRGKLVFHSLRKYLNDHMMKKGVEFEPRCQFFGHSVESVNVATYSNKFNVDDLSSLTSDIQNDLYSICKRST
ncbi:phage integrase SAM-like domain-containing protein [Castellaniella sp.]|uniref:phage integrase SAM-like domain-containing protein n=1 Tax=Castellaniella sp. TaxID=1955812 RepID=UPI002AFEF021|nr:phage integrase SAM-like domain-containing protein [Castellaniella sp.]